MSADRSMSGRGRASSSSSRVAPGTFGKPRPPSLVEMTIGGAPTATATATTTTMRSRGTNERQFPMTQQPGKRGARGSSNPARSKGTTTATTTATMTTARRDDEGGSGRGTRGRGRGRGISKSKAPVKNFVSPVHIVRPDERSPAFSKSGGGGGGGGGGDIRDPDPKASGYRKMTGFRLDDEVRTNEEFESAYDQYIDNIGKKTTIETGWLSGSRERFYKEFEQDYDAEEIAALKCEDVDGTVEKLKGFLLQRRRATHGSEVVKKGDLDEGERSDDRSKPVNDRTRDRWELDLESDAEDEIEEGEGEEDKRTGSSSSRGERGARGQEYEEEEKEEEKEEEDDDEFDDDSFDDHSAVLVASIVRYVRAFRPFTDPGGNGIVFAIRKNPYLFLEEWISQYRKSLERSRRSAASASASSSSSFEENYAAVDRRRCAKIDIDSCEDDDYEDEDGEDGEEIERVIPIPLVSVLANTISPSIATEDRLEKDRRTVKYFTTATSYTNLCQFFKNVKEKSVSHPELASVEGVRESLCNSGYEFKETFAPREYACDRSVAYVDAWASLRGKTLQCSTYEKKNMQESYSMTITIYFSGPCKYDRQDEGDEGDDDDDDDDFDNDEDEPENRARTARMHKKEENPLSVFAAFISIERWTS